MPWDAGPGLDRLGASVRGLSELRQRRQEANRALMMQLLGQGVDIWKTIGSQKLARELPSITSMATARANLWELGQKYGPEGPGYAELVAKAKADLEYQEKLYPIVEKFAVAALQPGGSKYIEGKLESGYRTEEELARIGAQKTANVEQAKELSDQEMTALINAMSDPVKYNALKKKAMLEGDEVVRQFFAKVDQAQARGMKPMEFIHGYPPSAYGDQPSETFAAYTKAVNSGLQRGISTITNEKFITNRPDGSQVENWTLLTEGEKERVLSMVMNELRAAGLKDSDPNWQTYIDLAKLHMSYDHTRDNPGETAPVSITVMPGGAGVASTVAGGGTIGGNVTKALNTIPKIAGSYLKDDLTKAIESGIEFGSGKVGSTVGMSTLKTLKDTAAWILSGLTGGLVDIRQTKPKEALPAGISEDERDVYRALVAMKQLASGQDVAEIESALSALQTAPDNQIDYDKIRALMERIQKQAMK